MGKRTMIMVLAAAIAVALTLPLWAGGGQESAATVADAPVRIQVAYPVAVDAPISQILDQYAREFEEQNPGVVVETVFAGGYNDVRTMVQTTMDGGGRAPALAVLLATDLFDLANAQYIEPMTDLLADLPNRDSYLNDFLPAFLENSWYMDDIWSLPFQRSAVVMYYNADLLAEAGLEPPRNWAELGRAAQQLTVRQGNQVSRWGIEYPSDWPYWLFQPLAIGAGQNIVGDGDTEVFFDNPAVVSAIEFYNSLSGQFNATPAGVQASWGNVVPNFVSGNTAMIVHSSGSMANVLRQASFTVGVMGLPGQNGGSYSVPGGGNLYLTAGLSPAERQAAFDFAVFLTEPARAAQFSIQTGFIASRKSAFEVPAMREYIAANPQAGLPREILASAGKELALQNLNEVRNIFHNYLEAAFNGRMSAAEAMRTAQQEADAALADFR